MKSKEEGIGLGGCKLEPTLQKGVFYSYYVRLRSIEITGQRYSDACQHGFKSCTKFLIY